LADRKVVTLLLELKAEFQTFKHQQQQILAELAKNRRATFKPTPTLPDGVALPLQTMEQLTILEKRLKRSPEDKQMMVILILLIKCGNHFYRKFTDLKQQKSFISTHVSVSLYI